MKKVNRGKTFVFRICPICGGGPRRHLEHLWGDDGRVFSCSRHHDVFVAWSKEQRWKREGERILKRLYLPILEQELAFSKLILREKR